MKAKAEAVFAIMVGVFVLCSAAVPVSYAASARELDVRVDEALESLSGDVTGIKETLNKARGVLVFPGIWKAGLGFGGLYGEGGMKVGNAITDYYSIVGLTGGFQMGVQKQTLIMAFMENEALNEFRQSDGWEFGLDGSVALIKTGIDGSINSMTHNEPIITFVIDQTGLMYNLTLEGYKLTRIKK